MGNNHGLGEGFVVVVLEGMLKGGRVDLVGMGSECDQGALYEYK